MSRDILVVLYLPRIEHTVAIGILTDRLQGMTPRILQ